MTNNAIVSNHVQNTNTHSIRPILDNDKLTRTNFLDWYRNLRIVLKKYVLDGPVPDPPASNTSKAIKDAWSKHFDDATEVTCLMLATMIPELQKTFEFQPAYEMMGQLKQMFQIQSKQERYETITSFISCKMQEGTPVSNHVLKMKAYVEQLSRLVFTISDELETDIILHSLPKSFNQLVLNVNMNNWEKSISKLHRMLKTADTHIPSKGNPIFNDLGGKDQETKPQRKGNYERKGKGANEK
ncbi:uncharacterized protein LOC143580968 [Bidens hawaiensis]|uniref:uncharacterized protein LOC143580968 n=1 Tax=Bidens hawaiensis TaxID=980011 RepID=UPI00404B09C2